MTPPADLLAAAKAAHANAYAPYSGFHVGAALRGSDGHIYSGANIENASYGLSRCAEQSTIQAMASAGVRGFEQLVIYTEADTPATPCGACRQILVEFAADAKLWLVNHHGETRLFSVQELLPEAFTL